jgi:hypothetical protein
VQESQIMFRTLTRFLVPLVLLIVGAVAPAQAQTALNSSTLSAAVGLNDESITVTSASTLEAGQLLVVGREAMQILSVNSTTIGVSRGQIGTAKMAHPTAALFYSGAKERFGSGSRPLGACTRSAQRYLPYIQLPTGDVWDCPTGTGVWALMNPEGVQTAKSVWFNLDNGSGTTIDDVLVVSKRPIRILACRAVEVDATAGTVAAGNWKVGTTVGGAEVVAATAYTNSATVGTATAGTIVSGAVAADTAVYVRHTGVAATAAGQAFVECDYVVR